MKIDLFEIYKNIDERSEGYSDGPRYSVKPIQTYPNYFIGKGKNSVACLLIPTNAEDNDFSPPIRLENLDIQFNLLCKLNSFDNSCSENYFSVLSFTDSNLETTKYFLSICHSILELLDNPPTVKQLSLIVDRLIKIFKNITRKPSGTATGLFGELFLISRSRNPSELIKAWRITKTETFDFSDGNIRIEVKTTSGNKRTHNFSFDQCNPPSRTVAILASLFAEQIPKGKSLSHIISKIEHRISNHPDLILKLYENVSDTLGSGLNEDLNKNFDIHTSEETLKFFDLKKIPAIRDLSSPNVSNVRFCSNLEDQPSLTIKNLEANNSLFVDLLETNRKNN